MENTAFKQENPYVSPRDETPTAARANEIGSALNDEELSRLRGMPQARLERLWLRSGLLCLITLPFGSIIAFLALLAPDRIAGTNVRSPFALLEKSIVFWPIAIVTAIGVYAALARPRYGRRLVRLMLLVWFAISGVPPTIELSSYALYGVTAGLDETLVGMCVFGVVAILMMDRYMADMDELFGPSRITHGELRREIARRYELRKWYDMAQEVPPADDDEPPTSA
ncbi:MAG: hypothetical protein QM811_23260 [Pirellulales bacterium]